MISITSIEFLTDIGLSLDCPYYDRDDISEYDCHPTSKNSKKSYSLLKKSTSRDEIKNIMKEWIWYKSNKGYYYDKKKKKVIKDSGYATSKFDLIKEGKDYMIFVSDDYGYNGYESARSQIRVRFKKYKMD